jgi:competence protein ComEC
VKRGARRLWFVAAALMVALVVALLWDSDNAAPLQLVFLDVGQGDAVFIRAPEGQTALYDGGRSATQLLAHLDALGVERIDLMIASHADFDHIGGLVQAAQRYPPRFFMDNGIPHTTQAYANLMAAIEAAGSTYLEATPRTLTLGSLTLRVLPPPFENIDQNDNSVGILLEHGTFRALLSGDATTRTQRFWQERYPELLPAVVYKAAHHGSRTGDRVEFMRAVSPEVVVIGVGDGNPYGHPHPEALESYRAVAARIYRTDQHGSVTVVVPQGGLAGYRVYTGELNAESSQTRFELFEGVLRSLLRALEP